jgi:sec-independent protein translocase protein TatA
VFHLGAGEIIALIFLALLLFGAQRLPQVMKAAGEGLREFKKASRDVLSEIESSAPARPAGTAQAEGTTEQKQS